MNPFDSLPFVIFLGVVLVLLLFFVLVEGKESRERMVDAADTDIPGWVADNIMSSGEKTVILDGRSGDEQTWLIDSGYKYCGESKDFGANRYVTLAKPDHWDVC